jgi:hypothetical protein
MIACGRRLRSALDDNSPIVVDVDARNAEAAKRMITTALSPLSRLRGRR